jgi:hypothetical protein
VLVKVVENVKKNYLTHNKIFNDDYPTNSLNIEPHSRRRVLRVLLEKPPVPQILKEFSALYGNIVGYPQHMSFL